MDAQIARCLTDELEKHPYIAPFNKDKFANLLMGLNVGGSSRFYEEIPESAGNSQLVNEGERYHFLSLRRVIRKRNAVIKEVSGVKLIGRYLARRLHIYSSTILARDLRENQDIVDMMFSTLNSGSEFSLLGKFETYEKDVLDSGFLNHTERPILVIQGMMQPESESLSKILQWEEENISRRNEKNFSWLGL